METKRQRTAAALVCGTLYAMASVLPPLSALALQFAFALLTAKLAGLTPVELGLCHPHNGRAAVIACGLWAALAVCGTILMPTQSTAEGTDAFLRLCIAAPIVEEIAFRGVILACLRPWGWAAVVAQASLFAVMHTGPAAVAYAFGAGLILGWCADHTQSLWPGLALHVMNNCLVFLMGGGKL